MYIADETETPTAYFSWISFSDSCFMIRMGAIRQFTPVKLFIGVLVSNSKFIPEVEQRLIAAYGPIDHRSEVIPFDFTDYYEPEMDDLIDRVFFSFERLIEADQLPEIKRQTNHLEDELAPLLKTLKTPRTNVKRPVNLDPGLPSRPKSFSPRRRIFITESIWPAGSSAK